MKLLKQTETDCMIAASAMVLDSVVGLGCEVSDIVRLIGHDGMEVLYPDLDVPMCRRGVHIQEIVHAAYMLGIGLIEFDPKPVGWHVQGVERVIFSLEPEEIQTLAPVPILWLGQTDTGGHHAIAWDPETQLYFDPRGFQSYVPRIKLDTCWAAFQIRRPNTYTG